MRLNTDRGYLKIVGVYASDEGKKKETEILYEEHRNQISLMGI